MGNLQAISLSSLPSPLPFFLAWLLTKAMAMAGNRHAATTKASEGELKGG